MFLPTSMEGTVDIFHLCCSLNNRRKLTNGMIINRQFYLLQELHRFYKKKQQSNVYLIHSISALFSLGYIESILKILFLSECFVPV